MERERGGRRREEGGGGAGRSRRRPTRSQSRLDHPSYPTPPSPTETNRTLKGLPLLRLPPPRVRRVLQHGDAGAGELWRGRGRGEGPGNGRGRAGAVWSVGAERGAAAEPPSPTRPHPPLENTRPRNCLPPKPRAGARPPQHRLAPRRAQGHQGRRGPARHPLGLRVDADALPPAGVARHRRRARRGGRRRPARGAARDVRQLALLQGAGGSVWGR